MKEILNQVLSYGVIILFCSAIVGFTYETFNKKKELEDLQEHRTESLNQFKKETLSQITDFNLGNTKVTNTNPKNIKSISIHEGKRQ